MENNTQHTSIYQELMNNRTLMITEVINTAMLTTIMPHLFYLDSQSDEPIHVYISSPGGDVMAGCALIDIFHEIKSPIYTYAIGTVDSMASIIFLYGDKRVMFPNAQIMIHQPLGGVQGQASDIVITANRILEMKNKLTQMVVDKTTLDYKTVEDFMDRDTWLNYDMAKKYGFLTIEESEDDQEAA